jgi:hypothetical protein
VYTALIKKHRHLRAGGGALDLEAHLEPALARQLDVDEHQVGLLAVERGDALDAVDGGPHRVAVRAQVVGEDLQVDGVVLDHQDLLHRAPPGWSGEPRPLSSA